MLDDELAKRLAGLKIETFFTLLSEIKCEGLIDALADRPTDVEIETLGETVAQRYAGVFLKNWLTRLGRCMLRQLMRQWQRWLHTVRDTSRDTHLIQLLGTL